MNIKIKDKTYVSKPITVGVSREAMQIYEESLDLLELQQYAQVNQNPGDIAASLAVARKVKEGMSKAVEIQDRKCELLVRVYDNQFSLEDVYNNLTSEEVNAAFESIIKHTNGVIEKNG